MKNEFKLLKNVILKHAVNVPVYYMNNSGSYGDALIRQGTLEFFKDIGLNYFELFSRRTYKIEWWRVRLKRKGLLIFGGGGAWCKLYNREPFIKKISEWFRKIIILPSTYQVSPSIPDTIFFRRDKFESKLNMPDSIFCHDMAFYLRKRVFKHGKGIGYFFRKDRESSNKINYPPNNRDISSEGNHLTPVDNFFEVLSEFRIIYTDRLHVAIAGVLLNKEVHLYKGSYFKNKAVYLSSLGNFSKKIYWHEDYKIP